MHKEIKYPYRMLTDLERKRINDYIKANNTNYKKIYVYYTTDFMVGAGYSIIISDIYVPNNEKLQNIIKDSYKDITDLDNLLENY